MKLIDKEKTKRAVTYWSRHGDPLSTRFDKRNIEDVINDQPIVEAIPIEWLKKFANERALNDGMDCYWHFWGEDLFQMIELWEKENESN